MEGGFPESCKIRDGGARESGAVIGGSIRIKEVGFGISYVESSRIESSLFS